MPSANPTRGLSRPLLLATAAASLIATAALASETVHYRYDPRGRLTATVRTGTANSSLSSAYVLDRADNRTFRSVVSVASGSFELPEVGSGIAYRPSVAGATFASSSGVSGNGSAFQFGIAPDGVQVGFLQSYPGNTGSIELTATGLSPGASYRVLFHLGQRPFFGSNPVTVSVDDVPLGTFEAQSVSLRPFASDIFQAPAANVTITFAGTPSEQDSGAAIDLVAIGPP